MNRLNHIVYHAYGNKEILCEAALSLLSFFKYNSPSFARIHIYTDDEKFFKNIFADRVECLPLTLETVKLWRGDIDFVHRVKVKMLQDFVTTHQGVFVYLDTDTFIVDDLSPVFKNIESGNVYMHTDEGSLSDKSNPMLRKTHKFVSHKAVPVYGQPVRIPATTTMFNAGVLGFSSKQVEVFENVLYLTDAMYPLFPKHVVEQLAFSFYFQQTGIVQTAEKWIYHYWNFKEFRRVLTEYFEANPNATFDQHLKSVDKLDPREWIKPKLAFEQRSGWWKTFAKLRGKSWEIGE